MTKLEITRRTAVGGAAALGIALVQNKLSWAAEAEATGVISTTGGPIRGHRLNGVARFLGIPYGRDTRARRFQDALPVTPWTDVRNCFEFGGSAPQQSNMLRSGDNANPEALRAFYSLFATGPDDRPPPESEDCLFLNVYTPDASSARKRPVMFWLHGGGFAQGSASTGMYDGNALCKRGDVVVVTINHRLNAMGYLYLGAFHDDFADSGNVGQLDQILALEWVRDNIEAFGGDPENVTIFGESGGGAKVSTLLAMPRAHGLFHKAIIESGPGLKMVERDDATGFAEQVLAELGVPAAEVHRLQTMDYKAIIEAASKVQAASGPGGGRSLAPVVDGRWLPRHPFDPDAPETARNIPLIIGTNKDEATLFTMFDPRFGKMTVEEVRSRFKASLSDKADAAFELFRTRNPDDQPTYWYTSMVTAGGTWINSIRLAERKAAQKAGAVCMYRLDWETPVMNGMLKAPHGLDTPMVFDNVTKATGLVGEDMTEPVKVGGAMAQAWINFAKTGDPSQQGLAWPAYETGKRQTMIFDVPSHVVSDPDKEVRKFFST